MYIENINNTNYIKVNDTATRIQLKISDNLGNPFDLKSAMQVVVVIGNRNGRILSKIPNLLDDTGVLEFGLDEGDLLDVGGNLSEVGDNLIEVHIIMPNGEKFVAPSSGHYKLRVTRSIDTLGEKVTTVTLDYFIEKVDEKIAELQDKIDYVEETREYFETHLDETVDLAVDNKMTPFVEVVNERLAQKANKEEVFLREKGININDFDESTRQTFLEAQGIDVNYVLGERNVKHDNIDVNAVRPINTSFLRQSPNLFNKNDVINGYNISSTTGELVESPLTSVTGKIEVSPNELIQFPEDIGFGVAFYDENDNFIIRKSKIIGETVESASPNAKWMRIVVATSDLSKDIMVNKGETLLPYEPYGVTFEKGVFVNNPDELAEEIQELKDNQDTLKEQVVELEGKIPSESTLSPILTQSLTTPAQGHVIMSFYENRIFGVNGSRTQIWYCDDGEINERKNFIVDSNMAFSEVVAISKTKVLAHNDNDSSLYLIENKNGTPIAEKVLEWVVDKGNFSFSTDLYPRVGGARMILMAEYGAKDPVDYPRHVHLSEDGGRTWRIIFELPNEKEGRTHLHGVHYDPYADRIWVCNGDMPASNLWYSDDWRNASPTWTRVFPSLNAPTQFTSIYSTPKKVLFGTDGSQNGIWVVEKDVSNQKKAVDASDVKPYFIIDPSNDTNYVGRRFLEYPGSKGIFIVMSDAGTTRGGAILASPDGEKWFQIIKKEPSRYRLIYLTLYKNKLMYSYGGDVYETVVEWYNE